MILSHLSNLSNPLQVTQLFTPYNDPGGFILPLIAPGTPPDAVATWGAGHHCLAPIFSWSCTSCQFGVNIQDMKTTDNPIKDVLVKASTAGYTMADVCRVAQIDQSQVSRWLSGRTKPLYDSVKRLNDATDALVAARLEVLNKAMDEALK